MPLLYDNHLRLLRDRSGSVPLPPDSATIMKNETQYHMLYTLVNTCYYMNVEQTKTHDEYNN